MTPERRPYVAANWKMWGTRGEARDYCARLVELLSDRDERSADVAVCAPFTALEACLSALESSGVRVAAQNMHERAAGAYTGEVSAEHPYGEEKAALACRFAREHGVDLSRSYGYADHHSDAPFLRLFGYPVCVNPTPRLRTLAAAAGWAVEEWRPGGAR